MFVDSFSLDSFCCCTFWSTTKIDIIVLKLPLEVFSCFWSIFIFRDLHWDFRRSKVYANRESVGGVNFSSVQYSLCLLYKVRKSTSHNPGEDVDRNWGQETASNSQPAQVVGPRCLEFSEKNSRYWIKMRSLFQKGLKLGLIPYWALSRTLKKHSKTCDGSNDLISHLRWLI